MASNCQNSEPEAHHPLQIRSSNDELVISSRPPTRREKKQLRRSLKADQAAEVVDVSAGVKEVTCRTYDEAEKSREEVEKLVESLHKLAAPENVVVQSSPQDAAPMATTARTFIAVDDLLKCPQYTPLAVPAADFHAAQSKALEDAHALAALQAEFAQHRHEVAENLSEMAALKATLAVTQGAIEECKQSTLDTAQHMRSLDLEARFEKSACQELLDKARVLEMSAAEAEQAAQLSTLEFQSSQITIEMQQHKVDKMTKQVAHYEQQKGLPDIENAILLSEIEHMKEQITEQKMSEP